ncbi:16S rRNA (guanine(527)-N(7))-methyltransferase RsmG [Proteinivorax tanatarense]|uniref:Ribosomal RNA small subunit methyltransferase G n=1 Tax=Proteinivorax tanatarense TaxID=1260629 RepID=A0AAU7VQH8_9FIRM
MIINFNDKLKEVCNSIEIDINNEQIEQLNLFKELLLAWNEKMNLTAIVDEHEIIAKHFLDSMIPAHLFSEGNVIDVGTGAGFPILPLKILKPQLEVYGLDALNKRILFLKEVSKELGVNLNLIHGRAEDYAKKDVSRETFKYATARAVAPLNILAEYNLPFLKIGGEFIAYKGSNYKDELNESEKALELLGGKVKKIYDYKVPIVEEDKYAIVIEKIDNTPTRYPRKPGIPKKRPL